MPLNFNTKLVSKIRNCHLNEWFFGNMPFKHTLKQDIYINEMYIKESVEVFEFYLLSYSALRVSKIHNIDFFC